MRFHRISAGNGARAFAVATMLWAGAAAAVTTDDYEIPYIGGAYLYEIPDSARHSDDGQGGQIQFGAPLSVYGYPGWSAEATLHRLERQRDIDGKHDYQTGLLFDLVYDFNNQGFGITDGYRIKPFVLGGLGVVQNDVQGDSHEHFGVDLGGGALLPLGRYGWKGLAVRVEARALGQFDSKSTDQDFVVDYRFSVGLQLPLYFLYPQHSTDMKPAKDCALAVVDPLTGRSDCTIDSDRDGVADSNDLCPGTPSGVPVDGTGCAVNRAGPSSGDDDGDGVSNEADKCPATYHDLAVDATGCLIPQTLKVGEVQFDTDTAVLTTAARTVLDGIAQTFKNQENVDVQITGNTDNVGDASYNQKLSLQRAESVRQYLIRRGVAPARMMAGGAGDTNPVAPNDDAAGRARNRRVDFVLSVK